MSEHDSIKSEKSSGNSQQLGKGNRVMGINTMTSEMQKIMPSIVRKTP